MKIKFKYNKRFNAYITIMACFASLVLMVTRFGFPVERLVEIGWISLVMILVIMLLAAPLALILRWWGARNKE